MALPKLETLTHTLVVPSTKKTIEYRPFLVKEEKLLMQAEESNDEKQYLQALKDIVKSCTFGKLTIDTLTSYDLEYIFLQLRCKSIGETVEVMLEDAETKEKVPVKINLSEVQVKESKEKVEEKINLSDTISLKLRPIPVKHMDKMTDADLTRSIRYMIESVYDANDIYDLDDCSDEEVTEFIDSFPHTALVDIEKFVVNQPKVSHTVEFKGPKGHDNKVTIEGFQNFFL